VAEKTDRRFEPGQTTELFQTALTPQQMPFLHRYAVSNDGLRFLIAGSNNYRDRPRFHSDYGRRQLDRHAPEEVNVRSARLPFRETRNRCKTNRNAGRSPRTAIRLTRTRCRGVYAYVSLDK